MKLEGHIWKDKKTKYWVVYVPLLEISTQGTSKRNAFAMIEDAVKVEAEKPGLRVHAEAGEEAGTFTIQANEPDALIPFLLKRQRLSHGWTVRAVASRLKSRSPTAYAQYERGKRRPSIGKLVELLRAINPKLIPILKAG